MTLSASNHDHIGMAFEPPALYVPPRLHGSNIANLHTVLPLPEGAEFDYLLNGASQVVEGLSVFHFPGVQGVYVDDRFLEHYPGPWPAVMEVRCLKDGQPADLARLPLLNTLTAVPTHMRVVVSGNPVPVPPPGHIAVLQTNPYVFDADGVPLPFGYGTVIELLDPHPGIEHYDNTFIISHNAAPGAYRVRVTSQWGLEQTVTLTLHESTAN
ncbi:hypothetical protein ACIGHF_01265 [Stenotrophomonas sp. NPDC077464]|uniref:hypothetical protein n=1 Tax=unclassified Stenotrophomonas TaxID=196198 RepID=UPI0037D05C5A